MALSRDKKTTYLINQIAIREKSFFARYLFDYLKKRGHSVDEGVQLAQEYYDLLCERASASPAQSCFEFWLKDQTVSFVRNRIVCA